MEQMLLPLLFSLLVIAVFLATPKIAKGYRSKFRPITSADSSSPPPPEPGRLPIIGHIHHLLAGGSFPHRIFRELSARHGPLVLLRLGQVNLAVVSSREAAEEVLRTHDLCFASRPEISRCRPLTYDYRDIAMAPYGPNWRLLRKICVTELFTAKRVAGFAAVRKETVSALIDGISSAAAASPGGKAAVNIGQKLREMTNDIATTAAFSRNCRPEQRDAFLRIMKEVLILASGFSVTDLFPSLQFVDALLGVKGRMERHVGTMDAILDEIIGEHETRRRMRKESIGGNAEDPAEMDDDLLDVLLRARDENQPGQSISTENVKAIAVELFFAGTDTSASTAHWAMSELMRSPATMAKAQQEVRQAAKGKARIEEEDLGELVYLKQVIKETLRLHPPLPLLVPRLCRESCQVQGFTVAAGTRVVVNAWALGRDFRYWDEPEVFRPERFEGEAADFRGGSFEYLPFGAGRRICPGMNFGLANVELPLAQLLHCFDWELHGGISPEELDMTELGGSTAGRLVDLCLLATPLVI